MIGMRAEMAARVRALPVPRWRLGASCAAVLAPRERIGVCEWAERSIVLGPRVTRLPGRLDLARMPYMREPLEAVADPDVNEINLMASTQVSKSTFMHVATAYAVDCDPGPILWVLPDEETAKEVLDEKVVPIFEDSPALRGHLPRGRGKTRIRVRFDNSDLHIAWPRSPMKLASKAKKWLMLDEVDKFPESSSKEADPVSLVMERRQTYKGEGKVVIASTPTDHMGLIWRRYAMSDRRTLRCPCPRCGFYQRLDMSGLKWPKKDTASGLRGPTPAEIAAKKLAWYECQNPKCRARIEERERWAMVTAGVWCPEGCEVVAKRPAKGKGRGKGRAAAQGATVAQGYEIVGDYIETGHRGYWLNSFYSWWRDFSDIAAEWILAQDDLTRHQNFTNSWLAELWHHETLKHDAGRLAGVAQGYERGDVPGKDPVVLVCGVDKQQEHIWFVVRAYNAEGASWLVDYGRLDAMAGTDELEFFESAVIKRDWRRSDGERLHLVAGFVDSRYDGEKVLRFVRRQQPLMSASQGAENRPHSPLQQIRWDPKGRGKNVKHGLDYWRVNTELFKDVLAEKIARGDNWFVFSDTCEEYAKQLFAEHKAQVKGKREDRWMLKPGQKDNHLWDCEVLCEAAAFKAGVGRGKLPRVPGAKLSGEAWLERMAAARRGRR